MGNTHQLLFLTLCCAPCPVISCSNAVCNAGTNTQLPTLQYTKEVTCDMFIISTPTRTCIAARLHECIEGSSYCEARLTFAACSLALLLQDYDRIMGTNLESTYALCQVLQPLLAAGAAGGPQQQAAAAAPAQPPQDPIARASACPKGDACIVFISSVAGGPLAGRSGSLYAASKAALNQLAASFACEWAGQGIRVNSVAPWVTLTELGQQVGVQEEALGWGWSVWQCWRPCLTLL